MIRFTTVELPSSDAAASAAFMTAAFGFPSTFYGPSYVDMDVGDDIVVAFQGDPAAASAAPLAIFEVADLDAARTAITEAGGTITVEPFSFPGGRRFQFREPGGSELAVWVREGDHADG